jgi:hypothetical protein
MSFAPVSVNRSFVRVARNPPAATRLAEETQGDEGAAKLQEGHVCPVLVADLQAAEAVEPRERPFDHPAVAQAVHPDEGAMKPIFLPAGFGISARRHCLCSRRVC